MKKFRYKNIIIDTSHQWCGNIEEYFSENSEKLLAFLIMPRLNNKDNVLRIYEKGKLVKEENIQLSQNLFLYFFYIYVSYIKAILKYFSRKDKIIVISNHPFYFFFMTFQRLFFNIKFVFWSADCFPSINVTLFLFERLKKFYHDGLKYRIYLGDEVNRIMNGKVVNTFTSKTILWGVKPKNIERDFAKAKNTILYVGVIRPNVGLEIVYEFLQKNPMYSLKVIGICDEEFYQKNQDIIKKYNIDERVYFPNKFFFDEELNEISKECFVGIALYTVDKMTSIYHADPGKVKAYTEMNLPVIMSRTSSIYPFIEKFKAGEIIDRDDKLLGEAIEKVKKSYDKYLEGVHKFNKYFYYKTYYDEKFKFLEKAFE